MVNMQGAGDAYARRYIQNSFMPQHIKERPAPRHTELFCGGHHHCDSTQTVNYKVQIGPGGFWGGVLGFMNGFRQTAPTGLFNWNSFGTLNQAQMQPQQAANEDKLGNLKTLFPKFNIVSDGNGKYTATDADGKLVGQGLSYEEMCKVLGEKKAETTEGTPKPEEQEDTDPPTVKAEDPEQPDVTDHPPVNGAEPNGVRGGGGKSSKIDLNGWYKAYSGGSAEGNNGVKFSNCKSASEVCNMLLKGKMDYLGKADRAELTKQIIAKNPSVFNDNKDGTLKPGNNWHKLDIPSIDYIKGEYVAEGQTETDTNGNVSYVSNTTGGVETRRSQNTRDNTAQNMGYTKTQYRDVYKKGNRYYQYTNGKFKPLTPEETKLLEGKTSTQQKFRPTDLKGIYYDEQSKKHYVKNKDGKYAPFTVTENGKRYEIKQINSDGTWYDTSDNYHKTKIKAR